MGFDKILGENYIRSHIGRKLGTARKDVHGTTDPGREQVDSSSGQSVTDKGTNVGESGSQLVPTLTGIISEMRLWPEHANYLRRLTGCENVIADVAILHWANQIEEITLLEKLHAMAKTQVDPLPRCVHGNCLMDGGGEFLWPECGCRMPTKEL